MKKAVLKSLTRTLAIGLLSCCALTIYCLTSCSNQNEITEISQNEEIESDAFNSLMIDKSKISYTAKSNIISNISIAPASFNLWNNVIK